VAITAIALFAAGAAILVVGPKTLTVANAITEANAESVERGLPLYLAGTDGDSGQVQAG
jgi:hypothetical protein